MLKSLHLIDHGWREEGTHTIHNLAKVSLVSGLQGVVLKVFFKKKIKKNDMINIFCFRKIQTLIGKKIGKIFALCMWGLVHCCSLIIVNYGMGLRRSPLIKLLLIRLL